MKDRLSTAQPWLATLARLVLAGVFVWAGWPKVIDSEGTVRSVRAYQLMPEAAVRPFAYGLPLLELVIALLLVLGLATRLSALLTAALMVMFMVGVGSAWARGLAIDCGCFGSTGDTAVNPVPGYIEVLVRDTGLLIMALLLARRPFSRLSLDGMLGLTTPIPAPARA